MTQRYPNPGFTPDERYMENVILPEIDPYEHKLVEAIAARKTHPRNRIPCEMPGGCDHGHQAMNGVVFMEVRIDGVRYRICGGCWDALRDKAS